MSTTRLEVPFNYSNTTKFELGNVGFVLEQTKKVTPKLFIETNSVILLKRKGILVRVFGISKKLKIPIKKK